MKSLFRTILVPHDLSKHATPALEIAAHMAGPEGRLIVLHVVNQFGNELWQKKVVDEGRRRLELLTARTTRARGGPVVERRVEIGDPYRQISKAARQVDSIVMCTSGRTGLSHLVIGSVAEKVVRHAPVPVLTFRPEVAWPKQLFGTILVPHDFSRHATRALKLAASLAGPGGRLRVLHVVADFPEGLNRLVQRKIFAGERRQLNRIVARALAGRRGPAVQCRVESGDPYRHIVAAAPGADSIVMCTAGRTGLSHLVIGSVAEKTVRHAPVPVLTFRPAVARASGRRTSWRRTPKRRRTARAR